MMEPHRKNDSVAADTVDEKTAQPSGAAPVRQCGVTRERLPQTEMVRFVLSPDGVVTPDVQGKLPGRGVWITARREILDEAVKKGAFKRGFKGEAKVPDGLTDLVETLLLRRCQNVLSLAKKGGQIVLGYDQVRGELRSRRPGHLLEASDGAEDGRNKVYFLAKALYDDVKIAGALSSEELGMAFGRAHVIHGLIRAGGFSRSWGVAYGRLAGFRQTPEDNWFSRDGAG